MLNVLHIQYQIFRFIVILRIQRIKLSFRSNLGIIEESSTRDFLVSNYYFLIYE